MDSLSNQDENVNKDIVLQSQMEDLLTEADNELVNAENDLFDISGLNTSDFEQMFDRLRKDIQPPDDTFEESTENISRIDSSVVQVLNDFNETLRSYNSKFNTSQSYEDIITEILIDDSENDETLKPEIVESDETEHDFTLKPLDDSFESNLRSVLCNDENFRNPDSVFPGYVRKDYLPENVRLVSADFINTGDESCDVSERNPDSGSPGYVRRDYSPENVRLVSADFINTDDKSCLKRASSYLQIDVMNENFEQTAQSDNDTLTNDPLNSNSTDTSGNTVISGYARKDYSPENERLVSADFTNTGDKSCPRINLTDGLISSDVNENTKRDSSYLQIDVTNENFEQTAQSNNDPLNFDSTVTSGTNDQLILDENEIDLDFIENNFGDLNEQSINEALRSPSWESDAAEISNLPSTSSFNKRTRDYETDSPHHKKFKLDELDSEYSQFNYTQLMFDSNVNEREQRKNLQTNEDFFRDVRQQWKSNCVPNPHRDLTRRYMHKSQVNFDKDYNKPFDRKGTSVVWYYDIKIRNFYLEIDKMKNELFYLEHLPYTSDTMKRMHYLLNEVEDKRLVVHGLEKAREESQKILQFYYDGVTGTDAMFLTDDQLRYVEQQDSILQFFQTFYKR